MIAGPVPVPRTALARQGPSPPVRLGHLGLGRFFRAHAAWYTAHAPDGPDYGYAAFAGRSAGIAPALSAQGGCYTLVTRGPEADGFEVVGTVTRAHRADDHDAWLALWRDPALCAVTVTVTEAGYLLDPDGRLRLDDPRLAADRAVLAADPIGPAGTAPGRLLAGLAARATAGAGPVALVPCDNLPRNGDALVAALDRLGGIVHPRRWAELRSLAMPVTTVVDRITPATTDDDRRLVAEATGHLDAVPVVTEPFSEWVLAGTFPAGRPSWEAAGARVVVDAEPYAHRKLLLLNGAHSLLAYAGSLLGHRRTPGALADDRCREWLEEWWSEATAHLVASAAARRTDAGAEEALGEEALCAYRAAALGRFANARLGDRLERIAQDGSQKLPVRVVPVLTAARRAGRLPPGAVRIVAAWLCHLDGLAGPVHDVQGDALALLAAGHDDAAARRVLGALDGPLADDPELVAAVADEAAALASLAGAGRPPPEGR